MDGSICTLVLDGSAVKALFAHFGDCFAVFCMNNVLGSSEIFETSSNNSSLQCPPTPTGVYFDPPAFHLGQNGSLGL